MKLNGKWKVSTYFLLGVILLMMILLIPIIPSQPKDTALSDSSNAGEVRAQSDQPYTQEWTQMWKDGSSFGYGITESNGSIYIVGQDAQKIILLKYDRTGQLIWSRIDGSGYGKAVTVDADNAIYIAGSSPDGLCNDACLVKYNSAGIKLWNRTFGGSQWDEGYGVAVDDNRCVYLIGYYSHDSTDAFLAKYSSTGHQLWNKTFAGLIFGGITENNDSIYLTGKTTTSTNDVILMKCDLEGVPIWYRTLDERGGDYGEKLVVDENNFAIYIVGTSSCINHDVAFLAKFDLSGNFLWNQTWEVENNAEGNDIAIDSNNSLWIAGSVQYTDGYYDAFLVKYDSEGHHLLNRTWNGVGQTGGNGVAVDFYDSIYLTGSTIVNIPCDIHKIFLTKYSLDTDGDLIPDKWEAKNGLDPLNATDALVDFDQDSLSNLAEYRANTNPNNNDTDTDGMSDGWEITNALNPLINDGGTDADGDGLSNLAEFQYNTDPHDTDTDDDRYSDGVEIAEGTNPLDPTSHPSSPSFYLPSSYLPFILLGIGIAGGAVTFVVLFKKGKIPIREKSQKPETKNKSF